MHSQKIAKRLLFGLSMVAFAVADDVSNLGDLATNVTGNFTDIGYLMTGVAYLAGVGFGISAIFKFKQHKDNPTQIPIGTPFALLAVSVLLVFLPGLYEPAGSTIYGSDYSTEKAGGFTGSGADTLPGND